MRQDRAVYERPRKKRKKKHSFGKILLLVVCLFAGIFLYRHFRAGGYWTIAVFGVDSRDGNLGKGALSDVEMLASINKKNRGDPPGNPFSVTAICTFPKRKMIMTKSTRPISSAAMSRL